MRIERGRAPGSSYGMALRFGVGLFVADNTFALAFPLFYSVRKIRIFLFAAQRQALYLTSRSYRNRFRLSWLRVV